jgi:O-antigen/teichoic acid export membrane protein
VLWPDRFAMPQTLNYLWPRSSAEEKRLYVNQTVLFMALMGLAAGVAIWIGDRLLPGVLGGLREHGLVVPAFITLWVAATLLDTLPTVDENVAWQAKCEITLSLLRAGALSLSAILTRELAALMLVLLAFSAFKVVLLAHYVAQHHGFGGPLVRRESLWKQLRHAAPFAVSGMLYGLRQRTDQWVVAALFPAAQLAAFSIGLVLSPVVVVLRQSVNHVFLPSMSRLHAGRDIAGMVALNGRANIMVAIIAYPMLAFCFAFAEPLIALVYTPAYLDAVPVMRVYFAALVAFVVELQSVMLLLREGAFQVRMNVFNLCLSAVLSLSAALAWGLPGAALGSVTAIYVDRVAVVLRISRITGVGVRHLQDWGSLASVLAAAAGAALLAHELAMRTLPHSPLAVLPAAAALVVVVYPAALCLAGQKRLIAELLRALGPGRGHATAKSTGNISSSRCGG